MLPDLHCIPWKQWHFVLKCNTTWKSKIELSTYLPSTLEMWTEPHARENRYKEEGVRLRLRSFPRSRTQPGHDRRVLVSRDGWPTPSLTSQSVVLPAARHQNAVQMFSTFPIVSAVSVSQGEWQCLATRGHWSCSLYKYAICIYIQITYIHTLTKTVYMKLFGMHLFCFKLLKLNIIV